MNATQRSASMGLVAAALRPKGLLKVEQIMEGDEVNKLTDSGRPPRGNGGPPRGPGKS